MSGFVIRRIRPGGRVKIDGAWWRIEPGIDGPAYDGRLDGIYYAIGLYDARGYKTDRKHLPFAALWGTARHFYDERDLSDCDHEHCDWVGPECFSVDGGPRTLWWSVLWEEGWDNERWMEHQRSFL
jgi:hypothetical protein